MPFYKSSSTDLGTGMSTKDILLCPFVKPDFKTRFYFVSYFGDLESVKVPNYFWDLVMSQSEMPLLKSLFVELKLLMKMLLEVK